MEKKGGLNVESVVVAADLLLMLALVFVGVISRYVLHFSFSFTEELVCTGFVLLSTMGGALASKENGHYTLDLVTGMMRPKTRKLFLIVDTLLTLLAVVILFVTGITMVQSQMKIGSLSIALKIPAWMYGACVPFGLAFMIFRSVQFILKVIRTDADALAKGGEEK